MAAALAERGGGTWTQRVLQNGQGWQARPPCQHQHVGRQTEQLVRPAHLSCSVCLRVDADTCSSTHPDPRACARPLPMRLSPALSPDQAAEDEQLTNELLAPSHGDTARVGASVRALPCRCWLNARAAQVRQNR